MVAKDKVIKVTNRFSGSIGYTIDDMNHLRRQYQPGETKEITFEELEKLYYIPGGRRMVTEYLVVQDKEALAELLGTVEQEYYYTKDDVVRMLTTASLDEFLDCLDFAPEGVAEMIKDQAVELPCNDVAKRDAILKKYHFDVAAAVAAKNAPYDGGVEIVEPEKPVRRVATPAAAPKRRVVTKKED